jgi:hypothetical protein
MRVRRPRLRLLLIAFVLTLADGEKGPGPGPLEAPFGPPSTPSPPSHPPLPPPPPPPPSLPPPSSPPSAPPGLCTDTCNVQVGGAQVGVCDDGVGRQDGVAGLCLPGTDCSDCNVRIFATPLHGVPLACYQRALRGGSDACLQSMLGNGECDSGCNTYECGFDGFNKTSKSFGDCGRAKIEEACVGAMQSSKHDYRNVLPAQVAVSMNFSRFDLYVEPSGLLHLEFRLDVAMQWSSQQMHRTECGPALPKLLSVAEGEIASRASLIEQYAQTLLFLPTLLIAGQEATWPHTIVKSDYALHEERPWLTPPLPSPLPTTKPPVSCMHCVEYKETLAFTLGFRQNYKYFPFDQHDLQLHISIPEVAMSGCDQAVQALRDKAGELLKNLLPADQTWRASGDQPISRTTDTDGTNDRVPGCRIRVRVQRNGNTFVIKKIVVLVMIVYAALIALHLNPLSPPLVGARFAIQITAMLVIAVRSQENLDDEIGRNTELLWLNIFMFGQFAAALSALVESAVVHHLIRGGKDTLALLLDQIFRVLLPMLIYPACVAGSIAGALTASDTVSVVAVACGILIPLAWGVMRVWRAFSKFHASKARLARQLIDADDSEIDDSSESSLLREAFELFDLDRSGDIDANEVRSLLNTMFPLMPVAHRKAALKLEAIPNSDQRVRFEDFDDTILEWRRYSAEHDPQSTWREPPPVLARLSQKVGSVLRFPNAPTLNLKASQSKGLWSPSQSVV